MSTNHNIGYYGALLIFGNDAFVGEVTGVRATPPNITRNDVDKLTLTAIADSRNCDIDEAVIQPTCQPCGATVRKHGQICKRCAKLRGWR